MHLDHALTCLRRCPAPSSAHLWCLACSSHSILGALCCGGRLRASAQRGRRARGASCKRTRIGAPAPSRARSCHPNTATVKFGTNSHAGDAKLAGSQGQHTRAQCLARRDLCQRGQPSSPHDAMTCLCWNPAAVHTRQECSHQMGRAEWRPWHTRAQMGRTKQAQEPGPNRVRSWRQASICSRHVGAHAHRCGRLAPSRQALLARVCTCACAGVGGRGAPAGHQGVLGH